MAPRASSSPNLKVVTGSRPVDQFLTFRLARLHSTLNRQAGAVLKKAGDLKLPEWRVLSLLVTHGELNAAKLAEITGADRGLLSRTFRAMEIAGLIQARRLDDDRREVHVRLSAKGREVFDQTLPFMQERQQFLLDALDPREQQLAFKIIDKLQVAAGKRTFGGRSK
jgi:DNA-binding MarR family transcriptional regulator